MFCAQAAKSSERRKRGRERLALTKLFFARKVGSPDTAAAKCGCRTFAAMSQSIHQFKVRSLEGGEIDFADFAGKKVLVVNTASACGYTPQYAQLQELQEHFADRLVVVGFPCNDFGRQEPGDAAEIQQFCQMRFGVTFPLAEKVRIKGDEPHPLYKFLTTRDLNGVQDSGVTWNFQKYLCDEAGHLLAVRAPGQEVMAEDFLRLLEK
jgi:glutathione peroxidase